MIKTISNIKNQTSKIFKKINSIFIKATLFLFYFLIIGLISALYKLFKKNKEKKDSYWQDPSAKELDLDFKSPY